MTTNESSRDLSPDSARARAAAGSSACRRLRRRGRIASGSASPTVLAAGTAIATGVFAPRQVAAAFRRAHSSSAGRTRPARSTRDGVTYHCTLASAPAPEISGLPGLEAADRDRPRRSPAAASPEPAGMTWDCYVGRRRGRSVEILTEDAGPAGLEPGRG